MNQRLTTLLKKRKIIIFIILIFSLAAIGLIWQSAPKEKKEEHPLNPYDLLFKGKPSAVFEIGQTATLDFLQIDVFDTKKVSYKSFELDENHQRIIKNYLAVYIKVFNPSNEKTEILLIGLADEKGNKYLPKKTAGSNFPDMKNYGWNKNIFPRIIQEGYVFFEGVDENSENLKLIFALEPTGEKIAFELK